MAAILYPVLLSLHEKRCVIVGGGVVAARKAAGLLEAGARVRVISPLLGAALAVLHAQGDIEVMPRPYAPGMLAQYRPLLAFAATDSAAVNRAVLAEARSLGVLANAADDADEGDFHTMAAIRRGQVTVGIGTGGASPALAAHLRQRLEAAIGSEYGTLAAWLLELRPVVRARIGTRDARAAFWQRVIESPVLAYLRAGDEAGARRLFDQLAGEALDS